MRSTYKDPIVCQSLSIEGVWYFWQSWIRLRVFRQRLLIADYVLITFCWLETFWSLFRAVWMSTTGSESRASSSNGDPGQWPWLECLVGWGDACGIANGNHRVFQIQGRNQLHGVSLNHLNFNKELVVTEDNRCDYDLIERWVLKMARHLQLLHLLFEEI
jgi:hypothetical protein